MIKKLDILVLILLPVIAVVLSLFLKANLLLSIFLFFGLPSIYFSFRTQRGIKRAAIFSFVSVVFAFFVLDYFATTDQSWYVPTVFPIRIYGILAIEELIWGFFTAYTAIIIYEHFLDKGGHKNVGSHLRSLVWTLVAAGTVFAVVYLGNKDFLKIPFAYLWLGVSFILTPMVVILFFYPGLIGRLAKIGVYFFLVSLLHELTALQLGQWSFPGVNFIGWVELFGYRFPFEEFFFYIILVPIALLSYFEFFDDDHLKKEAKSYA